MKKSLFAILFAVFALAPIARANQTVFSYQGKLTDNGSPANGTYDMQFRLYDSDNETTGQQIGMTSPTETVTVTGGVFTTKVNFLNFGETAFDGSPRWLEVYVRPNGATSDFTRLTPRTAITPTPYAIHAQTAGSVLDGVVGNSQIALNAVTSEKIAASQVVKSLNGLKDNVTLSAGANITLTPTGNNIQIAATGSSGPFLLNGTSAYYNGGRVGIGTATPSSSKALTLQGVGTSSGFLQFRSPTGVDEWHLSLENGGLNFVETGVAANRLLLTDGGNVGIGVTTPTNRLHVGGGATITGNAIIAGDATVSGNVGIGTSVPVAELHILDTSHAQIAIETANLFGGRRWTLQSTALTGNHAANQGSFQIVDSTASATRLLIQTNGNMDINLGSPHNRLQVDGDIILQNGSGNNTVHIQAQEGTAADSAGDISLFRRDGTTAIQIDADYSNSGVSQVRADTFVAAKRVITGLLEITGGGDLSENFDVNALECSPEPGPGMIVCIDPTNPGELKVSSTAYDRTVAGVMAGAGGVRPGVLMGQQGSIANGQHPVALTGRVYCQVDAAYGAIQPGDLITTSDTPGHGMKVTDAPRAQGAIIGKAMTSLETGKGLVLVLVSLQ